MPDVINFNVDCSPAMRKGMAGMVFDVQAKHFREEVFALASERGINTDVAIAAVAELVGIVAAGLDEKEGVESLPDRLHEFNARVERFYRRRRTSPGIDTITPEVFA